MSQAPSDQTPPPLPTTDPIVPVKTRVERLNARIRDNPVVAALIVAGTIVIAVASFTDAATKLIAAVAKPSPAAARASLGQLGIPFTAEAFAVSARSGDAVAVKLFLVAGMDPSVMSGEGSALGNAAFAGQEKVVTLLLASGARIESVGSHPSALVSAAAGGHNDIVRLMLDRHPDAATIDEAFFAAIQRGNAQTTRNDAAVRLLAANGADVKKLAEPALVEEIERHGYGDEDARAITQLLLDLGADLGGSPGPDGRTVATATPLMAAAAQGYASTVRLLLSRRVPIDLRLERDGFGKAGWTALMMATDQGRAEVVSTLAAAGAVVGLKNGDGEDSLLIGSKQRDVETFKAVLARAENLESFNDRDGRTALLWLSAGIFWVDRGYVVQRDAIEALLDRGARVDAKDKEGRTALMLAARSGDAAAVRLLIAKGARVTDRDVAGLGPLEWARRGTNPVQVAEVVRLLQRRGS